MKMTDRPRSAWMRRSRLRMAAWADWSSDDVGSSATRTWGCGASARAIEMRWRWPPDSERRPDVAWRSVMPTDFSRSSASWRDSAFGFLLHWLDRLEDGVERLLARVERAVRVLEDHLDLPAIGPDVAGRPGPRDEVAVDPDRAARRRHQARRCALATVDLPLPLSPTMPVDWPAPTVRLRPRTARTSSPAVL